jgi:uncharacterized protein (DUF1330 family)
MPAYFVVNSSVSDPELLAEYRAEVRATFEGHDATILASTDEAETIEGQPVGPRLVIVRFPDASAFRAWYGSPAYQAVIAKRHGSTDGYAVLAEGRA